MMLPPKTIDSIVHNALQQMRAAIDSEKDRVEAFDRVMHNAVQQALAVIDSVDDRIEMGFIMDQFYAEYTDKDEVARGIIMQLRVHRRTQHKHYWVLAANKETWK